MIWACSPRDQTNFFGIKALMHVCMWILLRNSRYWDSNQDILWNWVQNMPSQATYFNSSFSNHRMRKVEGIKGSMGWKALFDKSHRITKMHSVVGTEGWGHFIFPLIHKKTIPAQPRVFLGSPGLCLVLTRRSGQVSRALWRLEHLEARQISAR